MLERFNRILPLPYPHFMAFAPLDVWVRMLLRGGAWRRISPRYWLRIAGGLGTSALATALTLPERLVVGILGRAAYARPDRRPIQVLCILGYFRSGTTHLHYLLTCDPRHCTPRWYQALAPQGWALSWAFLRWFLVPFLASTRPQDDVAIGPEWPAEDDFALCNWSLSSSMPGRMVLPGEWNRPGALWRELHNLDGLPDEVLATWRYHVWAFARKLAGLGRGRVVLLKTPSHTGRVQELIRVFGPGNVKFIHLSREPAAVLRSNIAMHRRFDPYILQPLPSDDEVGRRIVEEYSATERKFLAESADIPPGHLSRLRYQDLIADPLGELRRVYRELQLPWTDELNARLTDYLRAVRDYRAAEQKSPSKGSATTPAELPPDLSWMIAAFGHDRPALPARPLPDAPPHGSPPRAAGTELLVTALLLAVGWLGLAWLANDRLDWLTWPAGVALGTLALKSAGKGSWKLGLAAASCTLGVLLTIAYPATAMAFYRNREPMPFADVWDSTRDGLLATNNIVWLFLGLLSAYRIASRKQLRAPGS